MPYVKNVWVDNITPADAAHMNHIEDGIAIVESGGSSALTSGLATKQNLISYGTTPPASPADGDLWCLPADTTNGVMWMFRYRAGSASAYKWEFVGGADYKSAVETGETTSSTTNVDLATVGPSFTSPRAGEYDFTLSVVLGYSSGANWNLASATLSGAAPAIAPTGFVHSVATFLLVMEQGRAPMTASSTVKAVYAVPGGGGGVTFSRRRLAVRPVRVS